MEDSSRFMATLPLLQRAIRERCFHPSGKFAEFKKDETGQSIGRRFEEQVLKYPNKGAIKTTDHQLTYDEFNRAANRVAHAILIRCGHSSENIVVLLEHGAEVITVIMGVLKAGKCYVPLDPSFPRARGSFMLEDSHANLIVTNLDNMSLAQDLAGSRVEVLNISQLASSQSAINPEVPISPDALAYILYTSGSTGQPKGVMETHRNLLHEVRRLTNDLDICDEDRITLLGTVSFSGSTRSIFGSLLNGAGLFPFDVRELGFSTMAAWLNREGITIFRSGPTVFRQFINTLTEGENLPTVRLITTAGEPALKTDVDLYKKHFTQHCIFVNGLRATETGSVRHFFVDKESQLTQATVPLGYPIEDMEVLLLDNAGGEVGQEQVGEIAVKSKYLSPGYWNRPELNSSAFLSGADDLGTRIYLSGDLGRMDSDGCLTHLGRKDLQVKVRDQRVEILEVEDALLGLDYVAESVVELRSDESGRQALVAYVVLSTNSVTTTSELRRALVPTLPAYMIPTKFVLMESLSLLPTGKVDRRALPELGFGRPELQNPFVKSRTPLEEDLSGIWAEILHLDQVGIHDDFLDLGGDSLLAGQVISMVIKAFQVELPIRSLFESPTVADMAVLVVQNLAKQADTKDVERMLAELETVLGDRPN